MTGISMEQRRLGSAGLTVPAMGLGCAGMSMWYGKRDDAGSTATIHRALELGVNFFDTSDAYGPFTNERLLGSALRGRRDEAVIATKVGMLFAPDATRIGIDGSPKHIHEAIDGSLERLGTDHVDLYYLHRLDPEVDVEESVGAMAELVSLGKVRHLGLCEVGVEALRRAHRVHPIAVVQCEYSLWSREPEEELLPALRELGVGFVAYSPLGRGYLTGAIRSPAQRDDDDGRGQVQLMTLHAAKGLEFQAVFLTGMEEGLLPHRTSIEDDSIEEERRLAYVGLTRARSHLYLVHAARRRRFGQWETAEPSRFLAELPEDLLDWEEPDSAASAERREAAASNHLNAMRALVDD